MHANEFHSVYRQYKKDTESVVSWLASTAKSHGYPFDTLSSATPRDAGGPSSNRKGGHNKKANPSISRTSCNSVPHKQVITTGEFIQLATFIAKFSPVIPIPDCFIKTIDRVIILRTSFGRDLRDQQHVRDVESDESHDHFIETLKCVRDILYRPNTEEKGSFGAMSPERSVAEPKPITPTSSGSRFAPISMDETESSQDFIFSFVALPTSSERPEIGSDTSVIYVAETEATFDEYMFTCLTLILDLNHIRSYVRDLWVAKRNMDLDLAPAAIVTNIAISIGRGIIEEAEQVLNKSDLGSIGLIRRIYGMRFFRFNFKDADLDRFSDCHGMYERAEWAFIAATRILTAFQSLIKGKLNPRSHYDCVEATEFISDWDTKTDLEKFEADELILTQYWCDLIFQLRNIPDFLIEDQIYCSIREMIETGGKVTMSAVFASQIFLDINHILQADALESFKYAHDSIFRMKSSLLFWEGSDTYSNETEKAIKSTIEILLIFLKDPIFELKKSLFKSKEAQPAPGSKFRTFRYSPILSGLFLFHLRNQMRLLGLTCVGSLDNAFQCVHLYNALVQEGLVEHTSRRKDWPSIDMTIDAAGENTFWLGTFRLQSRYPYFNYIRQYYLKKGISTSIFRKVSKRNAEIIKFRTIRQRDFAIEPTLSSQFPSRTFLSNPTTIRRQSPLSEGFPADYHFKWNDTEIQRILSLKKPCQRVEAFSGEKQLSHEQIEPPQSSCSSIPATTGIQPKSPKSKKGKKGKKGKKREKCRDQAKPQEKEVKRVLKSGDLLKELAISIQDEVDVQDFSLLVQNALYATFLGRLLKKCETIMPAGIFLTNEGTTRSDIDVVGLVFVMSYETGDPMYLEAAAEVVKDCALEWRKHKVLFNNFSGKGKTTRKDCKGKAKQ